MPFMLFVSGLSGLIFEVIWVDRSGLVFGNAAIATALVLSSLMAGFAVGNLLAGRFGARFRSPLRSYAVLQISVAVSGLLVTYGLIGMTVPMRLVARLLPDAPGAVNAVRFVAAFIILVVPTAALGGTLPMLVGASSRTESGLVGQTLGRLYGWNTLGGVAGALGAELLAIKAVGISGSAWVAASMSIIAALTALALPDSRTPAVARTSIAVVPSRDLSIDRSGTWRLLFCAFAAGAALLALEVVWARFLALFVVSSTLSVSLILAVVLTGIGLGGLAAARLLRWRPSAIAVLPATAFIASCVVTLSYAGFQVVARGAWGAEWYRILWFATALTLPTAILSGAMFTLTGAALAVRVADGTHVAATIALANTIGGIVGPPIAAFVLLPYCGMEQAFFVCALVYAGIGTLAALDTVASWRSNPGRLVAATGLAALCILPTFRFGLMTDNYLPRAVQPYTADGSTIVAVREGVSETVVLLQRKLMGEPFFHRLMTNSFSMSGTQLAAKRYMKSFVYMPMFLRASPLRRILVVCYGVGVTTAAAVEMSAAQSIDVVEISPDIIAVSDRIYTRDERPLSDPRVHLRIEDGRNYLQTSTGRWDLITGEPPPPVTPGTVNLYTREYFQLAHDRLAEQGLFTYWLPVARRGEYDVRPIIKAFCDVFSDCSLWTGTPLDWMLIGRRGSSGPLTEAHLSSFWQDPQLAPRLREIGFERPEQIGATFLGDAPYLQALTKDVPPLTDNFPQRLRARPGRLTRNSGATGARSTDLALIGQVLDVSRSGDAFESSALIRDLWPEALRRRTLPFFEQQAAMNRVLLDGASPLRRIEELDALLTRTSLEELPLWALGSDAVQQRIARTAKDDGSYFFPYSFGVRALAGRDYPAAADWFARAEQRGLRAATARPLLVYALCLAGDLEAARHLSQGDLPSDPDRRHFWAWLGSRFRVGPGSLQPRR